MFLFSIRVLPIIILNETILSKSSEPLDLAYLSFELFLFYRRFLLDIDNLFVSPFVLKLKIFHFFYLVFKSLLLLHAQSFQILVVYRQVLLLHLPSHLPLLNFSFYASLIGLNDLLGSRNFPLNFLIVEFFQLVFELRCFLLVVFDLILVYLCIKLKFPRFFWLPPLMQAQLVFFPLQNVFKGRLSLLDIEGGKFNSLINIYLLVLPLFSQHFFLLSN